MATDKPRLILMADDDREDAILARDALREAGLRHELRWVSDGEALLDYLRGRDRGGPEDRTRRPDLVLLDLNMPRKDGREALRELRAEASLKTLPVVVLTTSTSQDDVGLAYELGAHSFVTKPVTFQAWVELMTSLSRYWFDVVTLPKWTANG